MTEIERLPNSSRSVGRRRPLGQKFVVARHAFGGIGDHISCLIGAWWLARRTDRTLVVDWRGSRFNGDPTGQRNCFADYYQIRDRLGGVNLIADDRVATLNYVDPIFPPKWTPALLATPQHLKHTIAEIHEVNQLVANGPDRTEPTIVLNQWVDPHPPRASVRALLDELHHTDGIRADAQTFWNANIGAAPAIGIHIRHGNGENIGMRAAYWLGPLALARQLYLNNRTDVHRPGLSGRFLDNMPDSLVGSDSQRQYERRFYHSIAKQFRLLKQHPDLRLAKPFLFTDAPQVVEGLREFVPNLVACPKKLLVKGAGPLHQLDANAVTETEHGGISSTGINKTITHEMFVELELLSRCNGLICMDSGFSIFAQRNLEGDHITFLKPDRANRLVMKVMNRLAR